MAHSFWRQTGAALVLALALSGTVAAPAFAQQGVRATVNGQPITDNAVTARTRLFTIEGNNGGSSVALDQLIEESVMLQEAGRIGVTVSDSQVEEAYLQVARNIRVSKERLDEILAAAGTNPDSLKSRLRASIAWNGVVQAAVVPQVQISELDLDQQAATQASAAESFDYILKEIIFVGAGASARTGQANSYRSSFNGCDGAVALSGNYTDAAVIDIGRRHATQLPDPIAQELARLNVGGITAPRVTEQGVSMYAICEKVSANDLTFIKEEIRAEAGAGQMQAQAETYLEELVGRSRIVRN